MGGAILGVSSFEEMLVVKGVECGVLDWGCVLCCGARGICFLHEEQHQ